MERIPALLDPDEGEEHMNEEYMDEEEGEEHMNEGEEHMKLKQKIIGKPLTDIPQAGYMVAARQLAKRVMLSAVSLYTTVMNKPGGWFSRLLARRRARRMAEGARFFLESDVGRALVSWGLAAGVQAFPIKGLDVQRRKLAYMLRLEAYSIVGDKLVDVVVTPFQNEIIAAIRKAEALENDEGGADVVKMEAVAN